MLTADDAIIERIAQVREYTGLSLAKFAARIGHTKDKQSSIEHHKKVPSDEYIRHMCEVYHVRYDWIMTGEGTMITDIKATIMKSIQTVDDHETLIRIYEQLKNIIDLD